MPYTKDTSCDRALRDSAGIEYSDPPEFWRLVVLLPAGQKHRVKAPHGLHARSTPSGRNAAKRADKIARVARGQCLACPHDVVVNASVDHIVPRSAGGTSDETNRQWVVADVNGWKGATPMTRVVEMARKIVQVSCGN